MGTAKVQAHALTSQLVHEYLGLEHSLVGPPWTPLSLPNFTRADLAVMMGKFGFKKGVEVGVAQGCYSATLCQCIPDIELACVDPWELYPGNPRAYPTERQLECMEITRKKVEGYNVKLIKAMSMDAVRQFAPSSLDFVYIDGNHCFDYVMEDLIAWGRCVRSGGIIAGDDYYVFKWAGVIEAVQAYTNVHGVKEWFLTSDVSRSKRLNRQPAPSFFWVKLA